MARSLLPSEWNCLLWLSCPSLATAFLGMCGSNNIFQFIGLCTKRTHVQTQWETTGRESKILEFEVDAVIVWDLGFLLWGRRMITDVGKRMNWIFDDSEWTAETVGPVHQIFPLLLITWCDYISSLHEVKSDRIFDVHWLMKWESFTIPSFEITSTASDVSFRKDYVKPQPAHSGCIVGGRKKSLFKNNLSLRDW